MRKKYIESQPIFSSADQSADFVELFFDLVFVFAITKITHLTAHHLDLSHILRSLLIFWLIWWGWTQFTWTLNAANTKHPQIRLGTLVATGIAFAMAVSTDMAFDEGALWFAIPYIAVRILGLGIQYRVTSVDDGSRGALVWTGLSFIGLAAVFVGAITDPSSRVLWWLAAIGMDLVAGLFGGKKEGWNIRAKHFSERHSLIVIIALGESLIVAASALSAGDYRTIDIAVSGGLAVLVTCLLWWSYFAWIREYMEHALDNASGVVKTRMGRDVFSFIHFPLLCGIIGVAVSFEQIISHPDIPLSLPISACLGSGVILFIGSTAASVWKSSGVVLVPRLIVTVAIAGCTYLFIGRSPEFALGLTGIILVLLLIVEWGQWRGQLQSRSEYERRWARCLWPFSDSRALYQAELYVLSPLR